MRSTPSARTARDDVGGDVVRARGASSGRVAVGQQPGAHVRRDGVHGVAGELDADEAAESGRDVERPRGPTDRPVDRSSSSTISPRSRNGFASRVRLAGDRPSRSVRALREIGPWMSTARASAFSLSVSIVSSALDWFHHGTNRGLHRLNSDRQSPLVPLISSVLELIHDTRRGDRRATHRADAPTRTPARPAPAPRRHERRASTWTPSPPRRSCTGARSSSDSTAETLRVARRRRAAAARLGWPRRTPAAHAPADAGRRMARHARHRGPPRRRRVQRPVRGRRTSRRTTTAPSSSLVDAEARLARPAGAAGRPDAACFHQRMTLRNTGDTPYTVQSLLLDVPGAVGRDRAPRHDGPPPARAHAAAARRSPSARICARAGAAGRAPTRRCSSPPGARASGSRRGRVHGIHVAWSGNHRVARRAGRRRARRSSPAASCSARARSILAPGESIAVPVGHRLVGRRAQRALAPLPRRVAAPARSTRGVRVRSRSTPGRPSTSTTTSRG